VETLICVLLGFIQGLTEFLPVSSSGHLALAEQAFGLQPRLYLATALHFGTLAVVIFWFRHDLKQIGSDLLDTLKRRREGESLKALARKEGGFRTMLLVVAACVPTAAVGLTIESVWTRMAASTIWVSCLLLVTAALLLITRFVAAGSGRLTLTAALLIGVAQGIAASPGISRSGATIAAALLLGATREQAAKFSFYIAIPAILGACILEARHLAHLDPSFLPGLLLGVAVSVVVGYFALSVLLKTVTAGRLHWYSGYLIPLGAAGLIISFWGR
jgi:undecaprenyl-diphosphatase